MTAKYFTSPVGRLLYGSLSKAQTKDGDGKPLVVKEGPNAGKPTQRYAFGLGIAKVAGQHWAQTEWGAIIWSAGHEGMPQHAGKPDFAWKIIDGDSTVPNENDKIPAQQEGYPGHWILRYSSSFAPSTFNADGSLPIAPESVKTGYFVQVAGSVDVNNSTRNPGVYLNHSMVALQYAGQEIKTGADPRAAGFGQGVQRPAGALDAPAPGLPVTGTPPPPPRVAAPPAPVAPPAPLPPPVAVAPAPSFIAPPVAPPAPTPLPPPAAAGPVWKGPTGTTQAQYAAAGWSEEQMRAGGLLA
jgi:hypothetical protein